MPALRPYPKDLPLTALWNYLRLGRQAPPPIEEISGDLQVDLQPVVQRGLTYLDALPIPRGISLGFPEGTLLFDADRLAPIAAWFDGFVSSQPEHYFGRIWRPASADVITWLDHPPLLAFRSHAEDAWQSSPLPLESDPNHGSGFESYRIDSESVRLAYRLLADDSLVDVDEDVQATADDTWRGFHRQISMSRVPQAMRVAVNLAFASSPQWILPNGTSAGIPREAAGPLTFLASDGDTHALVQVTGGLSASWRIEPSGGNSLRLVAAEMADGELKFSVSWLQYGGPNSAADDRRTGRRVRARNDVERSCRETACHRGDHGFAGFRCQAG